MDFSVIGQITDIEIIAVSHSIRELPSLQRRFGRGRWRKLKGLATVRLFDGAIRRAEVHWYLIVALRACSSLCEPRKPWLTEPQVSARACRSSSL
jgi:hypothetical protein